MNDYHGLIALFIACVEFVLLLNALIFAEKNPVNKSIFILISLLIADQFLEFLICYTEIASIPIIFLKFFVMSLIPVSLLLISIKISRKYEKLQRILFFVPLILIIASAVMPDQFRVLNCSIGSAIFEYPFPITFGLYFVSYVLISGILLYIASQNFRNQKNIIIAIFTGLIFAVLPAAIIILFSSTVSEIKESLLGKTAFFLAITSLYFTLKYKVSNSKEK